MIHYRIDTSRREAHLFHVMVTVERPSAGQLLSLPAWIPGSYLVREFSRHLSALQATQSGRPVVLDQLDKATWRARCGGIGNGNGNGNGIDNGDDEPLQVDYLVYAFDTSVRAAFLDADRGFINNTSLCVRVEGRETEPHRLALHGLPADWQVATAMRPVGSQIGADQVQPPSAANGDAQVGGAPVFEADDYDELVDHPIELGRLWRGHFQAHGVPHEYVVAGALPDFDGTRLLADAKRICEAQIAFWHGASAAGAPPTPPFERYVFLHNLVEEGRGGLEHRASTALISPRRDMPSIGKAEINEGYGDLLGLISHEYFHTWNVKRLRPAEFARYDYRGENYTGLLWFFEGFTSYYDDLFLLRTRLIDPPRYLRLLARTVTGVAAAPGRRVQSVAQSSFDSWIKYYRADENTPNATISYYTKGSLVAMAFDLSLRAEGRGTLDDVMRLLWRTSEGGPIDEAQIGAALAEISGRSYANELRAWVHGTDELPLQDLLAKIGIDWSAEVPTLAQRLGLRVSESALTGVKIGHVLRDGAAEAAGLSVGDELIAVDGWRVRRLEDALRLLRPGSAAPWSVIRDQRLLQLPVTLPAEGESGAGAGAGAVMLKPAPEPVERIATLRRAWLEG